MSGLAHHDAVKARIEARTGFSGRVFDLGEIPDTGAPSWYVVVASTPGDRAQARFSGGRAQLTTTHTIYCVGNSARNALWVAQGVEAQCLDYRLVIPGRNVFLPSEWLSRPVLNDKDGLFPLPFGVIQFDLTSEPS